MAGEFFSALGSGLQSSGGFLGALGQLNALEQAEYQKSLRPLQKQQLEQSLETQALQLDRLRFEKDVLRAIDLETSKFNRDSANAKATIAQINAKTATETREGVEAERAKAMEFFDADKDAQEWARLNSKDMTQPAHQSQYITEYYGPKLEAQQNMAVVSSWVDRDPDFNRGQEFKKELQDLMKAGNFAGVNMKFKSYLEGSAMYMAKQKEDERRIEEMGEAKAATNEMTETLALVQQGVVVPDVLNEKIAEFNDSPLSELAPIPQAVTTWAGQLASAGSREATRVVQGLVSSRIKRHDKFLSMGNLDAAGRELAALEADPNVTEKDLREARGRHKAITEEVAKRAVQDQAIMAILKRHFKDAPEGRVDLKTLTENLIGEKKDGPLVTELEAKLGMKVTDARFVKTTLGVANKLAAIDATSRVTGILGTDSGIKNASEFSLGSQMRKVPSISDAAKSSISGPTVGVGGKSVKLNELHKMPDGASLYPSEDLKAGLRIHWDDKGVPTAVLSPMVTNGMGARITDSDPEKQMEVSMSELLPSVVSAKSLEDLRNKTKKNLRFNRNRVPNQAVKSEIYFDSIDAITDAAIKSKDSARIRKAAVRMNTMNLYLDNLIAQISLVPEPFQDKTFDETELSKLLRTEIGGEVVPQAFDFPGGL